ncbi:response regulator [Spirosoma gilvum]
MPTYVAIADDHHLVAAALSDLIRRFDTYEVILIAENGRVLLQKLEQAPQLPDIVLLDVNMPEMDGFATAARLRERYSAIRVLALSMEDREEQIVRMVRNGALGYLLKDCQPDELRQALDDVMTKGYYYSDFLTSKLITTLMAPPGNGLYIPFNLNERELEFVKLACSELTYTEIADKMSLSPRTIDGYREIVFQKMNVRTRVGMAIQAIRSGMIEL